MKILIITGGVSSEREISLMSATQVKKGLEESGYLVSLFDLKKGYPALKNKSKDFDVLFPVLHGEEGEGGDLQKYLSTLGKAFVGGDYKGYKTGWYKIPFKKFADKNKILTSPWKIVKNKKDIKKFGFPSVLKSSSGGSSKEVVILRSEKDLENLSVSELLKSDHELFVEKYLPGVEITVAVLEEKVLPVLEIVAPEGEWFDYQNKYWGEVKEIPFAPSVSKALQKKAQEIAEMLHKKLKLGQFSRTDFIVSDNKVYVLEVNTIPGLTSSSLFPKAASAAGIPFVNLLETIIKLAYEKQISKTQ